MCHSQGVFQSTEFLFISTVFIYRHFCAKQVSHLCLLVWTTQKYFILLQKKHCKYWDLMVPCSSLIQNQHLLLFADDCIQLTSRDQDVFRSIPETPKDYFKKKASAYCPAFTTSNCSTVCTNR